MKLFFYRLKKIDKWLLWLILTTILAIVVSILCLRSGIYIVFQNIFYIPIIIACVYYSRKGLYFSFFLVAVYLYLVFLLTDSYLVEFPALLRAASFIIIAAVISYLSSRIKYHQFALTKSREQYRNLVSNIPGVTYRCFVDEDWTMDFISTEIQRLTGYPVSDFIDNAVRSYGSIIHPQDRPYVKRTIFEASAKNEGYEIEYRIIAADNRVIWVLEKGKGIVNSEGSLEWLDGGIIDITRLKRAEETLKGNEFKYRSIIENSFDLISLIDSSGKFLYCNKTHQQILGYSVEELVGTNAFDLIPPKDRVTVVNLLQNGLTKGKQEESLIHKLLRKNGKQIVVNNRIKLLSTKDGKPDQLLLIGIDITKRVEALKELQQMKEDYDIIFQATHDAMFLIEVVDNKTYRYIRNNKAHEQATGISFAEIKGKTPQELLGEKLGNIVAANYKSCVEKKDTISYQEEIDLPAGKRIAETTLIPVFHDDKISYIVGSSEDITDKVTKVK